MNHARVWARISTDATGNTIRLPVILLLHEGRLTALKPLVHYFLKWHEDRSHTWMTKLCEITGQLLDYLDANRGVHAKPVHMFQGFTEALYNGTFNERSEDPSGLCWLPSNSKTINQKLAMLEEFSDWMAHEEYVVEPLNPWSDATTAEQRFNWIAWYRRNQHSFLGHIGRTSKKTLELEQARIIKRRRQPSSKPSAPKAFPAAFEVTLLRKGFIRPGKDFEVDILEKFDWRGICIAMLLLYGARRLSEPFHLWTGDVMENPTRPGEALVRIYHPIDGQAPGKPTINGRRAANRQAYLQAFYPKFQPRIRADGNYHAGFKGRAFADDKAKFLHVYWLPSDMGKAFLLAYHNYMRQRARWGLDGLRHPFAFVSHKKGEHFGQPYTIKSFEAAWARAIKRIGLPHTKSDGTTPHGGRHGAGVRANKAGVSIYDAQEMFGHRSPESQRTYRTPTPEQVTELMEVATRRLQDAETAKKGNGPTVPPSAELIEIWMHQETSDR
ncbi:MAG: site-specific integrase, partial [Massilia sp.]|nr:site-specific integrase [Massilia sp.]